MPKNDNNFEYISSIPLSKFHKINFSHTDSSFHICSLDRMDKFDLISYKKLKLFSCRNIPRSHQFIDKFCFLYQIFTW